MQAGRSAARIPLPDPAALAGVLSGRRGLGVHLQPIVDVRSGEVWGVEALARFPGHPHPSPADWFACAQVGGRGPELEALALRRALELLPRLPAPVRLSVNLSAAALLSTPVRALLAEVDGDCLLVELTEHEQVPDYPALAVVVAELRATGAWLGIDDFGAGHSSLRHVLHLEPDVLKLDLALVQGVADCVRRQALVEAMIAFCARTGTMLVAEGVEDAADLLALGRLGVTHAQGWFLARPAELDVVLPDLTSVDRPAVLVLP